MHAASEKHNNVHEQNKLLHLEIKHMGLIGKKEKGLYFFLKKPIYICI